MKKIQSITIVFENLEDIELDIQELLQLGIEDVGGRFYKMNEYFFGEEDCAYGKVSFTLRNDKKYERLLRYMDIAYLVFCYDDGSEKTIVVPYDPKGADGGESWLQRAWVDKKHCLHVEILPKLEGKSHVAELLMQQIKENESNCFCGHRPLSMETGGRNEESEVHKAMV